MAIIRMKKLLGLFSEYALIRYRVLVEVTVSLLTSPPSLSPSLSPSSKASTNMAPSMRGDKVARQALPDRGCGESARPVSSAIAYLEAYAASFYPKHAAQVKATERITNHNVKTVEYVLRERFQSHPKIFKVVEFIHSATSTSWRTHSCCATPLPTRSCPALDALLAKLTALAHEHAGQPMLSPTHGQTASPTTMGKEIANFAYRLTRQRRQLSGVELYGKMAGAVGNYNAHVAAYPDVAREFVTSFGLEHNPYITQIESHDYIADAFDSIARFNTVLLGLDRDMWAYISLGYFRQVNPIDLENSEGNLGLANALLQHLTAKLPISRWQVMRRYGVEQAYGQLKELIRGKAVSRKAVEEFVEGLAISEDAKQRLQDVTPPKHSQTCKASVVQR
eukprot:jgi/Mesen1/8754/ME000521S08087